MVATAQRNVGITRAGKWVVTLKKASRNPIVRLICLPYAGGGTGLFRTWSAGVDDNVELLCVVLPGRGARVGEPPYDDWESLLDDAFTALCPYLSEPHAFYGHSFGGRLAYELAQMATAVQRGLTRHLFVSGCRCPGSPQARPYLHQLPDDDFVAAVRTAYGVPSAILEHEMMRGHGLAALRSDIKLAELWDDWSTERLRGPITAVYGHDDVIDNRASMRCWSAYTEAGCELIGIPGGHFLVDATSRRLLDIVNTRLASES